MKETNAHSIDVKQAEQPVENPTKFDDSAVKPRQKRRRLCCCCFSCLAIVIVLALIIVILALTVFRSKEPKIIINSTKLEGVKASFDLAVLKIHLNLTLFSDMSLKNPNKVASFKHGEGTSMLFYRGSNIGQAVIPAGTIKADRTVRMNVTVTVYVDDFISTGGSNLIPDVLSGSLEMSARTVMSGRVKLIGIIKKHVTVYSSCNVTADLSARTALVPDCSNTFKL